jgi:hypothetical protein
MARKSQRQTLLESGEARGILKPEHAAELAALRAKSGASASSGGEAKAQDRTGLLDAATRSTAASKSLRLYDSVQPAIDRFNGGPFKGTMYDMVMPNEGGGFLDNLGAVVGAPVRAILPGQDKDDYQRINSAKAERIGLRSMEQKGVMAKNDEIQFKAADISASKPRSVNSDIIARQRTESQLTKMRSLLESKWVARYGSTSKASPNGTSFLQASEDAERDFMRSQKRRAPPSTRRAQGGWSAEEVK